MPLAAQRREAERPEHATAQDALDQGDDHDTVDTAVNGIPDAKEQRFAPSTLEGEQIRNLDDRCSGPVQLAIR
jgi:hypothetical protein